MRHSGKIKFLPVFLVCSTLAAADGNVVLMEFGKATGHGAVIRVEDRWISHWSNPEEYVSCSVEIPAPGKYVVGGDFAGNAASLRVQVVENQSSGIITTRETASWGTDTAVACYAEEPLVFEHAGRYTLELKPADPGRWKAVNIHAFGLVRGTAPPARSMLELQQRKYEAAEWTDKKSRPDVYWEDKTPIPFAGVNPFEGLIGKPSVDGGFKMEGHSLWCPSIIKVGDIYHMFASHWVPGNGDATKLQGWRGGDIVRATAKVLTGPYTYRETVLKPRPGNQYYDSFGVHNPKIIRHGDTFILYYIMIPSDAYRQTQAFKQSGGGYQMGIATAESIEGPWTRCDKPVAPINNPALWVHEDGSVFAVGKDKRLRSRTNRDICRMLAFRADTLFGEYKPTFGMRNSLPNGYELEDPCIWYANGQYNILVNDWKECSYLPGHPMLYYYSKDGRQFHLYTDQPVVDGSNVVEYDKGRSETFLRMERPNVFVNERGEVEAIMSTALKDYRTNSHIIVWPVDKFYPANE